MVELVVVVVELVVVELVVELVVVGFLTVVVVLGRVVIGVRGSSGRKTVVVVTT